MVSSLWFRNQELLKKRKEDAEKLLKEKDWTS
jgi:hypothetical protein